MSIARDFSGRAKLNGHTNGHANGHLESKVEELPLHIQWPHNIGAEQSVLGAVLLNNDVFPYIAKRLTPDSFFRDEHGVIFGEMLALRADGKSIDPITINARLVKLGKPGDREWHEVIDELVDRTPHAANSKDHADIVWEHATVRQAMLDAQKIIKKGRSGLATAAELVEQVKSIVTSVGTAQTTDKRVVSVATLADVRRITGESRWLWPGWIIESHMTVLAAEPGVGKTRLAMDLCRRMWNALPWPDGEQATRPPRTPSLWVASDRNHAELVNAAKEFGLPDEAVLFNAEPEDPFGNLKLDEPGAIEELAARIELCRPGFFVVDTINKATTRLLYRPEEAEAFFGPLLDVARETKTPMFALTHLSKGGDPLDRRIEGVCRVMWKMDKPDPDNQPHRRVLRVTKSNALYPPIHGVTMGTEGNDYDLNPPKTPAWQAKATVKGADVADATDDKGGRPPKALARAIEWLRDKLTEGPVFCASLIEDANKGGLSRNTLNRAIEHLGAIKGGTEGNQFYRLPDARDINLD